MIFPSNSTRLGLTGALGLALGLWAATAQAADTGLMAKIKQRGVLLVGIAADPPFEDRMADGSWVGFLPALEARFAESLGVKVEFVPTTFTTIVAGLQGGKYDLAGADLHTTEERKRAIDFSKPFYASGTSFFLRADEGDTFKTMGDLDSPSATIAVISGSSDETVTHKALPKANVLALPNAGPGDLVLQVKAGKATAAGLSSYFAAALIQRFGLVVRPEAADGVESLPEAWGIRKETPELTEAANKSLDTARADGTLAASEKQYLTPEAFITAFRRSRRHVHGPVLSLFRPAEPRFVYAASWRCLMSTVNVRGSRRPSSIAGPEDHGLAPADAASLRGSPWIIRPPPPPPPPSANGWPPPPCWARPSSSTCWMRTA